MEQWNVPGMIPGRLMDYPVVMRCPVVSPRSPARWHPPGRSWDNIDIAWL